MTCGREPRRERDTGGDEGHTMAATPVLPTARSRLPTMDVNTNNPAKDPNLPPLGRLGAIVCPRAMEVCAYLGPAPVSLEAYSAMLRYEFSRAPEVKPEHVTAALSGLVLNPRAVQMAGLAVSSGRSLFVYGPSGNGKSSLGRQI